MSLNDWYVGTNKQFTGTIDLDGSNPDISGDTVTIRLKSNRDDADSAAVVDVDADVASQGANGIYVMTISPDDTKAVTPGNYFYDIEWALSGGDEYILESGKVALLDRVSDVPA